MTPLQRKTLTRAAARGGAYVHGKQLRCARALERLGWVVLAERNGAAVRASDRWFCVATAAGHAELAK